MARVLSLGSFSPHVNERFILRLDGRAIDLTLASADALGGAPAGGRTPFSLVFQADAAVHLAQGTYRFEHPALGPLDIFIVPIGPNERGMQFEAIFT
jgi:hypothetical protein